MKTKHSTFLTLILFVLFSPLQAFAQQTSWDWPGHWHVWRIGLGFLWIFPLFMFVIMVICVVIFFFGHKSCGGVHQHGGQWKMIDRLTERGRAWSDPTFFALQILNKRFAKGEIPKQEYEEKKAAILSSGLHWR